LQDLTMIQRQLWISILHLFDEVRVANADSWNRSRSVSAEQRLTGRHLAAVAHAKRHELRDLMNHPLLDSSRAAAMASVTARIAPVLRKAPSERQLACD